MRSISNLVYRNSLPERCRSRKIGINTKVAYTSYLHSRFCCFLPPSQDTAHPTLPPAAPLPGHQLRIHSAGPRATSPRFSFSRSSIQQLLDESQCLLAVLVDVLLVRVGIVAVAAVGIGRVAVRLDDAGVGPDAAAFSHLSAGVFPAWPGLGVPQCAVGAG